MCIRDRINPEENYSLSFVGENNIPLIRVINGSEEENHYVIRINNSWELATPKNVASFDYQSDDEEGLFFITTYQAPNSRLVKILFSGEIVEIVAETEYALKSVSILEDFIVTNSVNKDMNSLIKFYSLDGEELSYSIPPEISGTLSSFSMYKDKLRFSASDFIQPQRYIDLDLETKEFLIFWEDKVSNFDPSSYTKTFTY